MKKMKLYNSNIITLKMQIPIINQHINPNIQLTITDEELPSLSYKHLTSKKTYYLRIFIFRNHDNKIHFYTANGRKRLMYEEYKKLLPNYNLENKILVELSDFCNTYFLTIDTKEFKLQSNHQLLNIILSLKLNTDKKIGYYNLIKQNIYTFADNMDMKNKLQLTFYKNLINIFTTSSLKTKNNIYIGEYHITKNIKIFFKFEQYGKVFTNITINVIKK